MKIIDEIERAAQATIEDNPDWPNITSDPRVNHRVDQLVLGGLPDWDDLTDKEKQIYINEVKIMNMKQLQHEAQSKGGRDGQPTLPNEPSTIPEPIESVGGSCSEKYVREVGMAYQPKQCGSERGRGDNRPSHPFKRKIK